jgi:hypothetical protein
MNSQEDNIDKRLRELLSKEGEENSFRVPADYFEKLPAHITANINAIPGIESSPSNPFGIPEGYFNSLPGIINEKVTSRKAGFADWMRLILRPRVAVPLFSMIVLIAVAFFYIGNKPDSDKSQLSCDDIKNNAFYHDIDEETIIESLNVSSANATEDAYEEYLIENNIDLTLIEKRL